MDCSSALVSINGTPTRFRLFMVASWIHKYTTAKYVFRQFINSTKQSV
jgi:hypothetical protein